MRVTATQAVKVMKDRFSDTSKQIFDHPEFEEIQNAIGQLEEIIRNARGRHQPRRASDEIDGGTSDTPPLNPETSQAHRNSSSGSATSTGTAIEAIGKDSAAEILKDDGGNPISINNNTIIIPRAKAKSNGIGKHGRSNSHNNIANDSSGGHNNKKNDKSNKPAAIKRSNSNGGNHIKSASSVVASYLKRQHSLAASASPSATQTTTSPTATTFETNNVGGSSADNESRRSSGGSVNDDGRAKKGLYIKANGVSKKSVSKSLSVSATAHHTSQPQVMVILVIYTYFFIIS